MIRQASLGSESVNFVKKPIHGANIARSSVQVNARNNVKARRADGCYTSVMKDGWFQRLIECIEADERSLNQLSIDAEVGRNYVQQMIKNEKKPGSVRLGKLLAELGDASAFYIFTGMRASAPDLELLRIASEAPREAREHATHLLRLSAAQPDEQEQSPESPSEAPSTLARSR